MKFSLEWMEYTQNNNYILYVDKNRDMVYNEVVKILYLQAKKLVSGSEPETGSFLFGRR